jgi:NAD(P)-dependent dehydrogenase (short-subunit alcohol dehydrogenase family)
MFRLDGRTALVTGAGHPVGHAVAGGLAAAGANLVIVDRSDLVEVTAAEVRADTDREVATLSCDLTSRSAISEAIDELGHRDDRIDILMNFSYDNGPEYTAHVLDTEIEGWDLCWTANVISQVRFCQTVGRRMMHQGGGVIVNLLSTVSFQPYVGQSAYCASKSAGWMFLRSLALECAPTVRVHGLATGSLAEVRDEASRRVTDFIPAGRYGAVDEVVGAAVYLASDAATFSTGDVVFADGGVAALSRYPTTALQPPLKG